VPSCRCVHSSGLCAYGCAGSIDRSRRCLPMLLIVGCQTVHITSCRCVHASGLHPHCFFNILPLTPRSVSTTNHIRPWASTTYSRHRYQVPAAVHLHLHRAPTCVGAAATPGPASNSACEAGAQAGAQATTRSIPSSSRTTNGLGATATPAPTIGPLLYYHHRSTQSCIHSEQ